jgi:hypothetical protein
MKHMLPITLALNLLPQGAGAADLEIRTVSGEFSVQRLFNCAKPSSLHIMAMKDEYAGWAA